MLGSKTGKRGQRVIWRISQDHPAGVLVQASEQRTRRPTPSEAHQQGFVVSTLDLLSGADVTETPIDSLPGELTDAFGKVAGSP